MQLPGDPEKRTVNYARAKACVDALDGIADPETAVPVLIAALAAAVAAAAPGFDTLASRKLLDEYHAARRPPLAPVCA